MKTISHMLLLVMALLALSACQQSGDGPSKPATANKAEAAK